MLDEPTNYLDIAVTSDWLENYPAGFPEYGHRRVSHNRHFLNKRLHAHLRYRLRQDSACMSVTTTSGMNIPRWRLRQQKDIEQEERRQQDQGIAARLFSAVLGQCQASISQATSRKKLLDNLQMDELYAVLPPAIRILRGSRIAISATIC